MEHLAPVQRFNARILRQIQQGHVSHIIQIPQIK
jgi:hypothetical protein